MSRDRLGSTVLFGLALLASVSISNGVTISPGQTVSFEFSSMSPVVTPPDIRNAYSYEGEIKPRPDAAFSFRVDLMQGGTIFASIPHDFAQAPQFAGIFSFKEAGDGWPGKNGDVRITHLAGPPLELTRLSVFQSMGGGQTTFEAVLVPEPTPIALLVAGTSALLLTRQRRRASR